MNCHKLTYFELNIRFMYFPETGLLVDRKNNKVMGNLNKDGYLTISINGRTQMLHRVVYCLYHGYFPENPIDHINRNRSDNRICNLREVSVSCNIRNSNISKANKSCIKGVRWNKSEGCWTVTIGHKSKRVFIGNFKNFINAVKARHYAEQIFDYPNCNSDSTSFKYLNQVSKLKFHSNITFEEEKQKKRNSVVGEWEFFCLVKKAKLDAIAKKN